MEREKGFTLIELLVVIAIIGILASVVLASLNTARAKGADAAIKSGLANTRAQAELFYDAQTPNSYNAVCSSANDTATVKGIYGMVQSAANTAGATMGTTALCNDSGAGSPSQWAASVPLKSVTNAWYCVDNTGVATTTSALLGSGVTHC